MSIPPLPKLQELMCALDSALTGNAPEKIVGQYHHYPATVEAWITAADPVWYLSDGGYSRVAWFWESEPQGLTLTWNSREQVKANWDKAEPERKALLEFLRTETKRLGGD